MPVPNSQKGHHRMLITNWSAASSVFGHVARFRPFNAIVTAKGCIRIGGSTPGLGVADKDGELG